VQIYDYRLKVKGIQFKIKIYLLFGIYNFQQT